MATLLLVRHGQSHWNLENRFTGQADVDLTAQGEAEARRAGRRLRDCPLTAAFTSVLRRARHTLALMLEEAGQANVPVTAAAALNERSYGDLEGLNKDETAAAYGEAQVHRWRRSYEATPPNGESLADTAHRVIAYYESRIAPSLRREQVVLVVAHGNSLRALIMHLERMDPAAIAALEVPTGAIRLYRLIHKGSVPEALWL